MAQGDYEVRDGSVLVLPNDYDAPEAYEGGQWTEGEAFGMYLPEAPGLYGLDGCGGRCPEPRNLTGSGRFVAPRAVATHESDIANRFTTLEGVGDMGALGEGLVQMIEGLSGFGDLGYAEDLAYGDLADLREGYPLGDITPEGEYDFEASGGGWSDEPYEDYTSAPPPDNRDIPQTNTPDQAELADILEQRRQAIADAIKQRNLLTQKVTDLDHQIVDVLNPQYQQALAAGDQEGAVKLGGELRVLNLKRAEAVKKALDWAQFQATASQMAKNVKAQLALNQMYQVVLTRQDPGTAQAIQQAYWEIGQATASIKQARQQALAQEQAQAIQQAAAVSQQTLTKAQAGVSQIATQLDTVTKELAALRTKKGGARIIPQAKIDSMKRLRAMLASAQSNLAAAQGDFTQKSQMMAQTQSPYAPQGYAQQGYGMPQAQGYGYDPYGGALQGLDGLDASVPYCTMYTRDAYGPTCMQSATMQLGDWSEPSYPSLAAGIAGIDELATSLEANMDIGSVWDVVGTVVGSSTQAVVKEAAQRAEAKKAKQLCRLECYKLGGPDWKKDQQLCIAKCEAGGYAPVLAPLVPNPFLAMETPVYKRWWFFPLCIAVGGIGYGMYRGLKAPRGVNGLAGFRRRRRRSHRR